jgi:hypothetical protein
VVLNWRSDATAGDLIGPAAIVGACLAWALDKNLTRKVSLSDPVQIAMIKGLVAGPVSLAIGYATGSAMPPLATVGLGALFGDAGILPRTASTGRSRQPFASAEIAGITSNVSSIELATPPIIGTAMRCMIP